MCSFSVTFLKYYNSKSSFVLLGYKPFKNFRKWSVNINLKRQKWNFISVQLISLWVSVKSWFGHKYKSYITKRNNISISLQLGLGFWNHDTPSHYRNLNLIILGALFLFLRNKIFVRKSILLPLSIIYLYTQTYPHTCMYNYEVYFSWGRQKWEVLRSWYCTCWRNYWELAKISGRSYKEFKKL